MEITKLIAGSRGRVVAGVTALVMGGVTQLVTSWGLQLPADHAISLSGMIAALTGWLIDNAAARINNAAVTQLQDNVPGLTSDGYAGPKTLIALSATAKEMPGPQTASHQLTAAEGKATKLHIYDITRRYPSVAMALRIALREVQNHRD